MGSERRWKRFESFQLLQLWVRELFNAGVDLVLYGQQEKSIHVKGLVDTDFDVLFTENYSHHGRVMQFTRTETVRLIGFSYGPSPEDWHAWFSDWRDEFAGEFWYMVEHPELRMPGAWVD